MTELKTRLIEEDPIRLEGELAETDAQRMRRIVVAAAAERSAPSPIWRRPFAMAALVALVAIVGTLASHRSVNQPAAPAPAETIATSGAGGGDDRRQLQFSTPGGTRIIWIFDQNLRLQETMP